MKGRRTGQTLLVLAIAAVSAFLLVTWLIGETPAERGLAAAIIEREILLEGLPEPSGMRNSPTSNPSACFWRCDNPPSGLRDNIENSPFGRTEIFYGPFEKRDESDDAEARIVSRLENTGYTFACTQPGDSGVPTRSYFFHSDATKRVEILEPLDRDSRGWVSAQILAVVDEGELGPAPCES